MSNLEFYEFWYLCPECESIWASDNPSPAREWCSCSSPETPELLEYVEE